MKGIDIFCASQAAITTMDSDIHLQPSSDSSNSGRAIDRHNPIIQDQKRQTKTIHIPLSFSTTSNNKNKTNKKKSETSNNNDDQERKTFGFADKNNNQQVISTNKNVKKQGLLGWGCTKPSEFISPATSSRFLLSDKSLSDQFDPLRKQITSSLPLPLPLPPPDHKVVVLRVSLHCKGCVKKMRKHISKMEGVTSFNIDLLAKTVTMIGDITPLAVLTSISKVKNAKLLTPTTISTQSAPQSDLNFSEIKKQGLVA